MNQMNRFNINNSAERVDHIWNDESTDSVQVAPWSKYLYINSISLDIVGGHKDR